jgi:hypothetical protein
MHRYQKWFNKAGTMDFIEPLPRRNPMKEVLIMMAIVGAWYLLQAYILPKLGVST